MGRKNSESSKYREWERERRERLNVSFNDLGSLLPNHDPAVVTSKVDILQKSAAYIRDLKKENSDLLLGCTNKIQTKKIKRLQRYVEVLLLRVQQLAKLLKDAGITLPPEPPSITPLGEKPLRWSNKISAEDAEKAVQSMEKSPKGASQKKSKTSKKPGKDDCKAQQAEKRVETVSPVKSTNPTRSSTTETTSSGSLLRTSQQNSSTDTIVTLPRPENILQESRSLPVSKVFGDTRVLTSLPQHIVSADQQPGIIVIHTTGSNTLGTVPQQPPQSTCFVIDSGNSNGVGNAQANAIVASHPPAFEPRPTFVLAPNGSLLPVLSAPQFVAQPRQLIVSTSSPTVAPTKQSLAPLTFTATINNPPCRKKLREVACAKSLPGDASQVKKVPIPPIPRNKQRIVSNSKDGSPKSSAKRKGLSPDKETSKSGKNSPQKGCEKKLGKSVPETIPSARVPPLNKVLGQNVCSNASDSSHNDKGSDISVNSAQGAKENSADKRKRDLDEENSGDCVQQKKKKCENVISEEKGDSTNSSANQALGGASETHDVNLNSNNAFNSFVSSCSVSSYSIDALCKMNQKISSESSSVLSKEETPANAERSPSSEITLKNSSKGQESDSNPVEESTIQSNSLAPENAEKSVILSATEDIPNGSEKSSRNNHSVRQLGVENEVICYSLSSPMRTEGSNLVNNDTPGSNCVVANLSSEVIDSSVSGNGKESGSVDGEDKGKDSSQSSILQSFGTSNFVPSSEEESRKEREGRESSCEASGVDESSLPPGTFSSDLFASLQVPSGHSESISPTAAFLLAFPLVSTLTGKTPDLGPDNHQTQPLTSMDSGSGDSEHSSGGCGSSFLQLGSLEDNSPSSSQSILSSLSSSNASSLQPTILQKSSAILQPLLPSSINRSYGHEAVETDVGVTKEVPEKSMAGKEVSFISSPSSGSLKETHEIQENSALNQTTVSSSKDESLSLKKQIPKESNDESRSQPSGSISSQVSDINSMPNIYSVNSNKTSSCDNNLVPNSSQNNRSPPSSNLNKSSVQTCPNNQLEPVSVDENGKKEASVSSNLSANNQQYAHYQLPYLSCSSTGVSEQMAASNNMMAANVPCSNESGSIRHDMQVFNHSISNSSNNHVEFPGLHQNSPSLPYPPASQRYKTGDKSNSSDHKQIQHNPYPSNSYSQCNTSNSLSSQVTTSTCFTVSSFTSSYPSSVSNSLFSSSTPTTSMPYSSANSSLSLPAPSYSDSVTFSASANCTYLGSSSSYIPPIYSNSLSQLSTSTASYASTTFPPPPVSVLSTDSVCRTTATVSKTAIPSFTTASSNQMNSFGSVLSNSTMSSMPPTSYINSSTSSNYDSGHKNSSLPIFSSHQRGSESLKGSNASVQQKVQDHRNSSSDNIQTSEGVKSHNIFSIDQLNTQSYGYNYNDYTSHVGSYVPQKPEMEMTGKKPPFTSSEGGNVSSRMPSSFSVAHNSSNFSILSWTTLSPMSAAPSSSVDPPGNSVNGKVDGYATGGPPIENSSSTGKVLDSHAPTFSQSVLPEIREITPSYTQLPLGNVVSAELSGSTGYHSSQTIKQHSSRGNGSKQRQQVTNWMTAPDPIHTSTDFSHNNETVGNDNARPDLFGNSSLAYSSSNAGFYGHHNHIDVSYASNSHTSANGSTCPENDSGLQSSTVGNIRVSMKGCSSSSGGHSSVGDDIHLLQNKQSNGEQNQLLPSTYDKMTSSSNYVHHSQGELPALPTLLGDLALGSCTVKSYLPVYEENNSASTKMCKQDVAKTPSTSTSSVTCNAVLPAKDGRDVRQASMNNDYGVSTFLSVSQLVENNKDSSQQSQQKENDRVEKSRNREISKSSPSSRRNMRPSNVKRDGMGMVKEHIENSQTSHPSNHNSQSFCNQGIPSTVVSSNPPHLHAPPIPFPPYKSVHWPVNEISKMADNSRNAANYKTSSSYSAEALIRPSLSTLPMESRIPDSEIPVYGMDIHKFPISNSRGDPIYPDFVEGNGLSCNIDGAPQQQNQLKQQLPDQRQGSDNFRRSHHSHSERFNYSSSMAPSSTFHSHHHPHLPPPNFGGHDEYSVETSNPTSTLGIASNCMDFPFSHPKEPAALTSSTSNVCLPLSYNPPNPCLGMGQSQNQQCRTQVEKSSVRNPTANCDDPQGRPSVEQLGRTKGECNAEGRSKQVAKETVLNINNAARTIPPLIPIESNSSSYLGHHHYHPHNHHSTPHHPGVSSMGPAPFTPINEPENQAPKLFSHLPPPSSGVTSLPHHNTGGNSAGMCGSTSSGNISSGTLANFNLSTIFPEINDKQNHQNQMATSSTSFGTSSKNEKLCTVSSSAPILHPPPPPPPPLAASYHHHQPHQHNHQSFPPPVDLGNRLPPPPSSVLHSNVGFNNLMVQSSPQVNGIAINSTLQPPPPSFSAPSFANVLPGL